MDGLNKLSARRKVAVIYTHPDSQCLYRAEDYVDRWIDEKGVEHVYLKPGGKYLVSELPDWSAAPNPN